MHFVSGSHSPSGVPGLLSTLQGPMNGILQSWTIPTHLVMGSLLGPMTLMRDLPLRKLLMWSCQFFSSFVMENLISTIPLEKVRCISGNI